MREPGEGVTQGASKAAARLGQAMLEYALLMTMITIVALVAASALGEAVATLLARAIIRL